MRRFIFYFILILLNSLLYSKEILKVKVPFNRVDMYLYRDMDKGKYEGVYVDILEKLEEKKNYKFEYIFNEKDPDVILRAVEPEELAGYKFIQMPITYRIAVLVKNSGKLTKMSDLKGLKIGYVENSRGIDEIEKRFDKIKFDKIVMKNRTDALESLKNEDIDALILSNWIENNSVETSVRVIENILYREQIAIKEEYNSLYNSLNEELKDYDNEKLKKTLDKNRINFYRYILKDIPSYEYVKEKYKNIKVKIPSDEYLLPIYYKNNGSIKGILPDIVKDIEKILNIPITITRSDDWDINGVIIEKNDLKKDYMFTKPYYQNTVGIANRKLDSFTVKLSDLSHEKIVMVKNVDIEIPLPETIEKSKIIYVETLEEGINKLLNYEGDYLIFFTSMLEGAITNNFLENKIKIAGVLNEDFSISMGIKKKDVELGNVFQTLVESFSLDRTMIDSRANKNILFEKNYKLIAQIVIPLIIFIIILTILILKAEANRKKAEKLSEMLVESFEAIHQLDQEEAGDHGKRLAMYSEFLAKKYNCNKAFIAEIKKQTPFHDIGKIAISKDILTKPGKLTEEEFNEVKKHTDIGAKIAKKLQLGDMAENIVRFHHEKWNGKGYPLGLKTKDIPLESRIVAIADMYDNLRQTKIYRKGYSHLEAVEIIKNERGESFEPEIVDIFEKNHNYFEKIYQSYNKSVYLVNDIFNLKED
ncbi:HD domain-containing phosphohydrolase [Fusobacterium sp. SYSU M8D902]|uniref:HD domain-containing phosphohydrolase n=1 Tax=Fusobacterium sp. SYSU M8D902 TaxID=3159562 RepID=UPI0032E4EB06